MPRYRMTHPFPSVFSELRHGIEVIVHRAPRVDPEGSTVQLNPGDEVETPPGVVIDHPHLELVEQDGEQQHGPVDPAGSAPVVGTMTTTLDMDREAAKKRAAAEEESAAAALHLDGGNAAGDDDEDVVHDGGDASP